MARAGAYRSPSQRVAVQWSHPRPWLRAAPAGRLVTSETPGGFHCQEEVRPGRALVCFAVFTDVYRNDVISSHKPRRRERTRAESDLLFGILTVEAHADCGKETREWES